MKLTSKQKELMKIANEKGYFNMRDAQIVYSSRTSRTEAIIRLQLLGLIEETTIFGRWKLKLNSGGKK